MGNLKICHWIESYLPTIGGGEVLLSQLVRAQKKQGHIVHILTNRQSGTLDFEEVDGVTVERFSFGEAMQNRDVAQIICTLKQVVEHIQREMPDVIHLHSQQAMAFFFLRLPRTAYGKAIYTAHDGNYPEKGAGSSLVGQVVDRVDAVVAPSEHSRRIYVNCFPQAASKICCIYNSLPAPDAVYSSVDVSNVRVVALGRMVYEKGFDVFIEAIRLLGDECHAFSFELIGDGPERPVLERLVEQAGLTSCVRFTGWVEPSDIFKSLSKASLVVVPSRWQEPFGLVALQAMQCGRAVVASAVGGLSEVVEDGETGLLVPPDAPAALATTLRGLLRNYVRMQEMGQMGWLRAEQHFPWKRCHDQYIERYMDPCV